MTPPYEENSHEENSHKDPAKIKLTTSAEGTWAEVMHLIGQAHSLVHQNGVVRVQTDIRVGTR